MADVEGINSSDTFWPCPQMLLLDPDPDSISLIWGYPTEPLYSRRIIGHAGNITVQVILNQNTRSFISFLASLFHLPYIKFR
jgi:hypothetical protein